MNNLIKFVFILFAFQIPSTLLAQAKTKGCITMKNCTMKSLDLSSEGVVVIKDSIHTEYIDGGKYFIKSKLEWINDCEYTATVIAFNWPEFSFGIGEMMTTKIMKIKKNIVYLEVEVRGFSVDLKYELVDLE